MEYAPLEKAYYKSKEKYQDLFHKRYNSENAVHLDFKIYESPAFFVQTKEMLSMIVQIYRSDKRVLQLRKALPGAAIDQFAKRCLVDEIIQTNKIEGIHSTRREISELIGELEKEDRRKRFGGLVQKYFLLQEGSHSELKTCQDIRNIYDELVLLEVCEDNPENRPDGKIFRKDAVTVTSSTQKVLHRGLYPESDICEALEKAIAFLNDDTCDYLCRIAVFHYLIGYIHPFYDGNGRLARFISSELLTKEFEPLLGYRLSYTIKENLNAYYKSFEVCNNPKNLGDLTPFVLMFLSILEKSTVQLEEALFKRREKLTYYAELIKKHVDLSDDAKYGSLFGLMIQAALFSEHGISTQEIMEFLQISRATLKSRLVPLSSRGLLNITKEGKEKYYEMNLSVLDAMEDEMLVTDNEQ